MSINSQFIFFMRATWIVILLSFTPQVIYANPDKTVGTLINIDSGGINRKAVLYVPSNLKRDEKPALVVVMHGGGGSAAGVLADNGWLAKAEQQSFIALAPEGLGVRPKLPTNFKLNPAVWNSGQYGSTSSTASINDVGFIRDLLQHIQSVVIYNEARVFVTGHSNGGGMTFRLATELSEKFAAVAMVAGRLTIENPKPQKPLPTLYIVGTVDPLMPLAGGEIKSPWGGSWTNRPVDEQLFNWAKALQCDLEPKTISETSTVKNVVYTSCTSNSVMASAPSVKPSPTLTVLYLKGHGHHWPGGKQTLSTQTTGPIVDSINATDVIWEFFNKY
jgi:polyhydroxybutyrate depolymerase